MPRSLSAGSAAGKEAALALGAPTLLRSLRAAAGGSRAAGSAAQAALAALGVEMSEAQQAAANAEGPLGGGRGRG